MEGLNANLLTASTGSLPAFGKFEMDSIDHFNVKRKVKSLALQVYKYFTMYQREEQYLQMKDQQKQEKYETYAKHQEDIMHSLGLHKKPKVVIGIKMTEVNEIFGPDALLQPTTPKKSRQNKGSDAICYQFIKRLATDYEGPKSNKTNFTTLDAFVEVLLPLIHNASHQKGDENCNNKFIANMKGERILPIWLLPKLCDICTTSHFKANFPPWSITSHCLTLLTSRLNDETLDENMKHALNTALAQLTSVQSKYTEEMKTVVNQRENDVDELNNLAHQVSVMQQRLQRLTEPKAKYGSTFAELRDVLHTKVQEQELKHNRQKEGHGQKPQRNEKVIQISKSYKDDSIEITVGEKSISTFKPNQISHRNDHPPNNVNNNNKSADIENTLVETKNRPAIVDLSKALEDYDTEFAEISKAVIDILGDMDLDLQLSDEETTNGEDKPNDNGDDIIYIPNEDVSGDDNEDMIGDFNIGTLEQKTVGDLQQTSVEDDKGSLAKDKDKFTNQESSEIDNPDLPPNAEEQVQSEITPNENKQPSHCGKKRSIESVTNSHSQNKKQRTE